ncbi:uncharacterized protein LOC133909661 isoform X2 [Phragmites australis]|uniref:uncharacterized protein LOC133909661 isoform X2 n=1 Tax=Phragmites australis TaxID=29695 RepID=UPI002D7A311C|nr:uncharacterized protein LOC133909661 isoform X2 [Phragmites australis]
MMGKWHGAFSVFCLLCAGALACLLPQSSGAADSTWHRSLARPDGISSKGSLPRRTPAQHHAGLPPLSAPPPTAGADLPPSRAPEQPGPHFGFPLQPTFGSAAPPVGPSGGEGYPFVGSNPTVPLPTGMTDTATVLPLPDTGDATTTKVVGFAASVRVQGSMIGLVLFSSIFFLLTS